MREIGEVTPLWMDIELVLNILRAAYVRRHSVPFSLEHTKEWNSRTSDPSSNRQASRPCADSPADPYEPLTGPETARDMNKLLPKRLRFSSGAGGVQRSTTPKQLERCFGT